MQLDVLRAFLVVVEEGSLTRAALRLHLAQSTLTRQMAALEHEVGARLLERTARGVAVSAAGHAFATRLRTPLRDLEHAMTDARELSRGERQELRIGFLHSIARTYLNPALSALRRAYPQLKVRLFDLCAGGQMRALQEGTIDLALLGVEGKTLMHEFYARTIASLPVVVALPENHPLTARPSVRLRDLRHERFVAADESELPGRDRWIKRLCRRAGFRPRFTRATASFAEMMSAVVSEDAVALWPEIVREQPIALTTTRPVDDAYAVWDLMAVWQRGRTAGPVAALLDALSKAKPASGARKLDAA